MWCKMFWYTEVYIDTCNDLSCIVIYSITLIHWYIIQYLLATWPRANKVIQNRPPTLGKGQEVMPLTINAAQEDMPQSLESKLCMRILVATMHIFYPILLLTFSSCCGYH